MKKMNVLSSGVLAAAVLAGTIAAPAIASTTDTGKGTELSHSVESSAVKSAAVTASPIKNVITETGAALEKIEITHKAEEVKAAKEVRDAEKERKEGQVKVKSEEVALSAPKTVKKKTDNLLIGETKVQSKAVKGTALKTTTTTVDKNGNTTVNEKFNITKAPKAEVLLVGTKEPVRVTYADLEASDESTDSSTSDSTVRASSVNSDGDTASSSTGIVNTPGASSAEVWIPSSQYQAEAEKLAKGTDDKLLKLALKQTGKRYVWGATGPDSFDCSGLVHYVYAQNGGMNIPRTAYMQGLASTPVSRADIQPGDIIWSKTHIGIYIGDNKMVHAANPSKGVAIDDINYYLNNGMKIGRL